MCHVVVTRIVQTGLDGGFIFYTDVNVGFSSARTIKMTETQKKNLIRINYKSHKHSSVTGEMGLATRGLPVVIRLLMNVICDKLKADYFLEGEAKHLAPSPITDGDGLVHGLHRGPVPTDCAAEDATGLSASYQDAIYDNWKFI